MNDPIIQIRNLSFHYGDLQILRNLNLSIEKNKITALIGASGSGKSTLLRTMNLIYRLYPKQKAAGEILFEGQNILADSKLDLNQLRARIGMVFQKPTPFPMSIYENIAFAIRIHERLGRAELDERIEQSLRQAALWDEVKDFLKKDARRLSGGQQQRLCIARTIAINPEVLLLDEPTAALDPISTKKIEELIKTLADKYTVVIVTHNMHQAQRISDFTTFMDHGEIIEFNDTNTFFNDPSDPRSKQYISVNEGH